MKPAPAIARLVSRLTASTPVRALASPVLALARPARALAPAAAAALAAGALAFASPAWGEDIDLFAGARPAAALPNVLLLLDNSANWSASIGTPACVYRDDGVPTTRSPAETGKKVGIEKCALYNAIDALPVAADGSALFNVGLMLLNESPSSIGGGYPRIAFRALTAANKATFKAAVAALGETADKANNAPFAKALHEAWLWYRGATPRVGTAGQKWDRAATASGSSAGPYLSPSAPCGRNHVIFIANGAPESAENNDARALLAAAGGSTAPIAYAPGYVKSSDQANWLDEYARFVASSDVGAAAGTQPITVHTISVTGASSDGLYPNFMRGVAKHGGGRAYEARDASNLEVALRTIFNEVQAVNSTFVAASLPVSLSTRGTYLNQVFIGMFRPDESGRPRWRGNVKQYGMKYDPAVDQLMLVDAAGEPAVNAATGFVTPAARSWWTHDSDFWRNQPAGTPPSASDAPDGEVVEKGGAAQRIRDAIMTSQSSRPLFTCIGCTARTALGSTSASRFERGNGAISAAALGVPDAAARDALIDWVRGTDNAGDEPGPGTTASGAAVTVRPSVHGDVLHSRPVVVNYGDARGIVVFYGANDGQLHAADGRQQADAGGELWSFVPEEFLGRLRRLRDNDPAVRFPTAPTNAPGATPRDYFVDGPIGLYQRVGPSGTTEEAILLVGMRRGGRLLYAFDVTDPRAPAFLWKRTAADLPILGQTWSEPRATTVNGYAGPVLVMGAGYDAGAEDAAVPGATTMGNAVLVLDARTGALVRRFDGFARSVAADVTLLDTNLDGVVDRAYAADLGGDVHRIDFAGTPGSWTSYKFAALGGGTHPRKFFFGPDVILTRTHAVVLVGSGDREKPLQAASDDRFFTLYDRNLGNTPPSGWTPTLATDLPANDPALTATASFRGCQLPLAPGEKVVNAPLSIGGITYFGTHQPSAPAANSCAANLGVARSYGLRLFCGAATATPLAGGGLPPSPVAGVVRVTYTGANGAQQSRSVPFLIGGTNAKRSSIEASRPPIAVDSRRRKRHWFVETER